YQNVLLKANFYSATALNETLSASDAPAIMIPVFKFPPRLKEKAWFAGPLLTPDHLVSLGFMLRCSRSNPLAASNLHRDALSIHFSTGFGGSAQ
ncbi:MAG TPA: hypothetical protein VLD83_02040, partial [Candidatus Binatia bacterium]|nr:hypothetical protein [Candidatus Binatia bacterium]